MSVAGVLAQKGVLGPGRGMRGVSVGVDEAVGQKVCWSLGGGLRRPVFRSCRPFLGCARFRWKGSLVVVSGLYGLLGL